MEPRLVPDIIFVLGAPGSGKGTLCTKMAELYKPICNLSVGDYLRDLSCTGEIDGKVAKFLVEGKLLPAHMIMPLLRDKIDKEMEKYNGWGYPYFIIDGFPRNWEQLLEFERQIKKPKLVLFVNCPENIARIRVLQRRLKGREETDTEMVFNKRYQEFAKNNPEILNYYHAMGLTLEIDSISPTQEAFAKLQSAMKKNCWWKTVLGQNPPGTGNPDV